MGRQLRVRWASLKVAAMLYAGVMAVTLLPSVAAADDALVIARETLLPRRVEEKKYEADLRQRLTDANLDGPRIAYLMADAEREIAIAHTRLSG